MKQRINPEISNPENAPPSQDVMNRLMALKEGTALPEDKPDEFWKAIQKLFDGDNIFFITELSDYDISNLIKLHELYKWSDRKVDIIRSIADRFMKLRVSKRRQGRKEFFGAFQNRNQIEEERRRESWADRWLGGGGR